MKVMVTGANGFIGKNLVSHLGRQEGLVILSIDQENSPEELTTALAEADFVFHLAGVNRPHREEEFRSGNADLTWLVCRGLAKAGARAPIVLSSSIQVAHDNPYGLSKREAELALAWYARQGGRAIIYRLTNVFGKWCRPDYNSVVATFCHNIANGLPISISDPAHELVLVHVDDVVRCLLAEFSEAQEGLTWREAGPKYSITLDRLADLIGSFSELRATLRVPDFTDEFTRKLYGTYLSYLPVDQFAYKLKQKCDDRGCLAEFVKSAPFGQVFVSRTLPGVTRGNHYHHTKTEKFLVLEGQAIIRFRHVLNGDVIEYPVSGEEFKVVDIPTGYTHSIENVGKGQLVTLFWASEVFDPGQPDTEFLKVLEE